MFALFSCLTSLLSLCPLQAVENKKVEDEVADKRRNLNFVKKFI
jgi:hypothetical protein